MANKAISELPQALNVNNQDLFVLEQSGIAKKLTAETFITEQGIIDALAEALDGHGGIASVTLSSVSGRIRTYLITFTDETTTTFQVLDGTSIDRIEKTSTAGLVDTYTIFMSDGTTSFFQVTNGSKGDPGVATDEQVTTAVNTWLGANVAQETGYVLDRTLSMSNAAAPADLVGDLKSSLSNAQSRITNLDGIIEFPQTEIGIVYVNNGQIAFANSNNVIRTKNSVVLKKGDKLISANTGFKFLVSYSSDGTSYLSSGWKDTNYIAPIDGMYYFALAKNPNVEITETVYNEILNNFSLYRESGNTVDLVQNIVESQKVNVSFYDGYYTANGLPVQSTENGVKYTSKISTFYGLTLDISISLASDNNLWVAVGEWKKDGTFERTTLFSGRSASWTGKRIIPQDVEEISIMFYGHNSFTFSVSALSNSVSIIDACAEMVNDIFGENISKTYAFSSHTVKGINHRGYNSVAPENTLPAFKLSVENGFSFVETDVRFTSDNVPVLLHDATVDRTSNGTGNIANMTFSQARELDFGSWKSVTYAGTKIPSLEEFIIFCRNVKIFPYLEISETYTDEQFNIMYDIVNKNGMSNAVTWISFNPSNLSKILAHDQTARVCRIHGSTLTEEIATSADGLKTGANEVFVSVDYNYIDNNTVTICKNHSLPLETWTINTAELIAALPSYVSGGTSDLVNFETVVREQSMN